MVIILVDSVRITRQNLDLMSCQGQKHPEAIETETAGHGVDQRMDIDARPAQQSRINDKIHPVIGIVDQGERRHRARLDPQILQQLLGRAKRQPSLSADAVMQGLQINHRTLDRGDQKQSALLVFEKQVFDMQALDRPTQGFGLLDREQGLVMQRVVVNAVMIQKGQ